LKRALAQHRSAGGTPGVEIASTLTRLGSAFMQEGRVKDAEKVLQEALEINRNVFGSWSVQAASSLNLLAVTVALDQRRLPEAIALYREAFDIREHIKNPATAAAPKSSATVNSLGEIRQALNVTTKESRPSHPLELDALAVESTPMAEVENALREAQRFAHTQYAKDSWEEAFYLALTTWVLLQEGKFSEAESPARQCLAIRLKLRPDDWSVFHARHMLGAALAGQRRVAEAESMLLEGYRGVLQRRATMPDFHLPRIGECILRIAEFYRKIGRADEAAQWQAEFNRLDADAKRSMIMSPRWPSAAAKSRAVMATAATSRHDEGGLGIEVKP
jgi:tetratricopeptide (TPR) repeat protein